MHCKNLGSDPVFLGSILRYLTHYFLDESPDANLNRLNLEVRAEYRELKVENRYTIITHNVVHPPSSKLPLLKGKASYIRDIILPLLNIAKRLLPLDKPEHRDMIDGLAASHRIEVILTEHKMHPKLPDNVQIEFRKCCFTFCQCQDALIRKFHPEATLFNTTMKSHYLMHLGLLASYINPQQGSCWAGEDLMQVVRRLVLSSAPGLNPAGSQLKAMQKYARAMNFEFTVARRGNVFR